MSIILNVLQALADKSPPASFAQQAEAASAGLQQQMAYLTYLNFGQHIIGLCCQLISVGAISALLAVYKLRNDLLKVKTLSRSMLFYLVVHLVCSSLGIPHLVYKVFWWQPLQPSVYSPYLLFWTGLPELAYMALAPVCVLYLILDRSLALRMAQSAERGSNLLFGLAIACAVAVYCSSWGIYLAELPLDLNKVVYCELASCEMLKYRNILQLSFKMLFGTANVFFCFLFLHFLAKSGKAKNLKNRVVKYTILLEIVFDVLPGYSAVLFNLITGVPSSAYVGEFAIIFCAIDATICSLLYLKLFLRQKPNTVTVIHPNGTVVVQPRWSSTLHRT